MRPNPSSRPDHPYRITRAHDRRAMPITAPQRAILEALAHLCPAPGSEACPRRVAAGAGMRYGSAMLALRNLERRRLAIEHAGRDAGETPPWSPTLTGRARVRARRPA